MSLITVIIFALMTAQIVLGKYGIRNYEVQMDHLYIINSPNGNSFNFTTLRITKFNRTRYIAKAYGVQLTDNIDNVYGELKINLMQGNVYKQRPYKIARQRMCDVWKNEYRLYVFPVLKDFSNLPAPDECPFPKKEYWVKDFVFDENNPGLPPYIGYGKYRLDFLVYENDIASGGFMFYINIVKPGTA